MHVCMYSWCSCIVLTSSLLNLATTILTFHQHDYYRQILGLLDDRCANSTVESRLRMERKRRLKRKEEGSKEVGNGSEEQNGQEREDTIL